MASPEEEVTPQPWRKVLEAPEPLVELLAAAHGRVLLVPVVCVREALELGVGHVAFSRARHGSVPCVCVCVQGKALRRLREKEEGRRGEEGGWRFRRLVSNPCAGCGFFAF